MFTESCRFISSSFSLLSYFLLQDLPIMFRTELSFVLSVSLIVSVTGHGRLIDPASRNAAWRYGFDNPPHYTDNELNCGGFNVQWSTNKGKCGVCGDPYHKKEQPHVYPGKYANNRIITKTYREGQDIDVVVELTSNHQGFFVFRVGKIGSPPITQEKLKYVLKQPNGQEKWKITSHGNDVFKIRLVLPKGLTCDHCVMQWWYTVGNNWGCDADGCGLGHGPQETFVNCADIRITASDGSVATSPPSPQTEQPPPPTQAPLPSTQASIPPTQLPVTTMPLPTDAPNPSGCKATGAWPGQTSIDHWCVVNCGNGYCPAHMCVCN